MRRWLLSLLLLLSIPPALPAEVAIPALRSPVTDTTGTLTRSEGAELERKLLAFEERKGSQVAVLMVPTTAPESIEQYATRAIEEWKLGRRGVDDSVLLVVAKEDHAARIEVGYGLEGAIPDVMASRIMNQVLIPEFREGRYAEGIDEGVDRIIALLDGEPLPPPQRRARQGQSIGSLLPFLLMLVFVGSGMARRMFGALFGGLVMAGAAGVITWVLTSVLFFGIGAGIVAFLFTLAGGGSGWGRGGWANRRRSWDDDEIGRGGGGGWGGGGWGGGGGGWSGGGGSSGGGGASGRW